MSFAVGDRIIRTYDGKLGVVEEISSAPGYVWVRFDDGLRHAVYTEHLRVLELDLVVG